jgi:aryl-alcohol dehydrogenase-like predicted oxidoreductase
MGKTELSVSRLGVASSYGVPAYAIEKAFHDYEVNYFYWGSFRRSGMKRALKRLARRYREKMVIALQSYDRTGLIVKGSVNRGLKGLGLDYADVLILGWHNSYPSERILKAAYRLRDEGKARFIALSGHNRPFFGELAQQEQDCSIDVFMVRYNAAHRGAETDVFPYLAAETAARPGVTCYTATRWGQLLKQRHMPQGERALTAGECYRFVMSNSSVDVCMSAPADTGQMEEALEALEMGPLSEDEMARVQRIGDHVRGRARMSRFR